METETDGDKCAAGQHDTLDYVLVLKYSHLLELAHMTGCALPFARRLAICSAPCQGASKCQTMSASNLALAQLQWLQNVTRRQCSNHIS